MSAVLGSRQGRGSGGREGFVYIVRGSVWQLWLLLSLCTCVHVLCACVCVHVHMFVCVSVCPCVPVCSWVSTHCQVVEAARTVKEEVESTSEDCNEELIQLEVGSYPHTRTHDTHTCTYTYTHTHHIAMPARYTVVCTWRKSPDITRRPPSTHYHN